MKQIVCSLLAAGAATLALAAPASAHSLDDPPAYAWRHSDHRFERLDYRWRALYRARRAFYRRWNGNPWQRARFERWYARRCDELRYRR
jgi:hypothetical protein